jgi:membrane protein
MANILQRLTLPGFERVPVLKVLQLVLKEIFSPVLMLRAKAIAFSFFLALFPSIIFLFSLLPYVPIDNFANEIIGYLKRVAPNKEMVNLFLPIVNDILGQPKVGVLSIGFLLIIFFMKNGVITMMQSFNVHFDHKDPFLFIKNQIKSIILTLIILFLFVSTIFLLVLGKTIMTFIFNFFDYDGQFLVVLIDFLRYAISISLNVLVVSILYNYGPALKIQQRFITPGSILATTLIIGVSLLFSKYIIHFGNYNKLYGSLGTIMLTMIWLYWNSMAILIGFEINRSIYFLKSKKGKKA